MIKKMTLIFIFVAAVWNFIGCAGPQSKKGTAIGSGVGAGIGAILGQAIGKNTKSTVLGAGIGAVVGGAAGNRIGDYMDKQEEELRTVAAQTDAVSVARNQDVLIATFKSDVLFDFNSAILKPGAYSEVDRVAGVLNQYPQTMIRIEGHTDSKGSEDYNQELSEKRAEAVKNAVIQRGVKSDRVQTIGYGESQPKCQVDAENRRVSIVITPISQG